MHTAAMPIPPVFAGPFAPVAAVFVVVSAQAGLLSDADASLLIAAVLGSFATLVLSTVWRVVRRGQRVLLKWIDWKFDEIESRIPGGDADDMGSDIPTALDRLADSDGDRD